MVAKVLLEGDVSMVDFPFIVNNNWIIPNGWYLLDDFINRNNYYVIKDNDPIIIIENIYIKNEKNKKISVIKTDKKLKKGDIIKWK